MFAGVCVDIAHRLVDQVYTYSVPEEWEAVIELGMRVEVPFGPRKLMGIVVTLSDTTDYTGPIKDLTDLLDYQSYLNEELLALSQVLAKDLVTPRIAVLLAMLPAMLKVQYRTLVHLIEPQVVRNYFQGKGQLKALEMLTEDSDEMPREVLETWVSKGIIQEWLQQEVIRIDYQVLDQQVKKQQTLYSASHPYSFYTELQADLPQRYTKQRALVDLIVNRWPFERLDLESLKDTTDISTTDLKNAVKRGWLTYTLEEVYRNPMLGQTFTPTQDRPLTDQQSQVFASMAQAVRDRQATPFLLEGVTGSGKTEVYLQLIGQVLRQGRQALLLVPEIALTPQMIGQVMGRFQTGVAVLHSGLSTPEKYDEWRRIFAGEVRIVVGARSSVFAPLTDLGLIIMDEEHETTYKQADNPRYHARDVALWRARYHHCPLVLGSATPSLESRARAEKGNYVHLMLTQRVNNRALPPVTLVDMTQVSLIDHAQEISPILKAKVADRLAKHEQVLLLLNRRGYANYVLCRHCGHVLQCPNCDISLTFHKAEGVMKCHYCDHQEAVPRQCPMCQSPHIRPYGLGTQKVAETLTQLFPEAKIIRMDHDTTRRKGSHRQLLDRFSQGQGDILIGTQMIAKGLDFENVTLVGVINADTSLHRSDFRAGEKTFQLLTQVAGRAGRGSKPGEVVIQTYNPNHYILQLVQGHRYEDFFYYEMQLRHLGQYPPYYFTSLITVSSTAREEAQRWIYDLRSDLLRSGANQGSQWMVLGPSQAPIARINQRYYFQIFLKYKDQDHTKTVLQDLLAQHQPASGSDIYISLDHEPFHFI